MIRSEMNRFDITYSRSSSPAYLLDSSTPKPCKFSYIALLPSSLHHLVAMCWYKTDGSLRYKRVRPIAWFGFGVELSVHFFSYSCDVFVCLLRIRPCIAGYFLVVKLYLQKL